MALQHKKKLKKLTLKECSDRFRRRKKLKEFAAELLKSAQTQPYEKRERRDIRTLDAQIRMSIKLPYRWTEKDLQRAWRRLKKLETTVLDRNYEDVLGDNRLMLENFHNTMEKANLDAKTRVQIALELLTAETEELFLHNGDTVEPSPQKALCFLTQDMDYTVPEWFNKELLNLLLLVLRAQETFRKKISINLVTSLM